MTHIAARIGVIIIALVVVLVGGGYGLFHLFNQHFYFEPPKADYPHPSSALEAQRQDLDYFRKLMELDRSFSPSARAQAEQRITALEKLPAALPSQKPHVDLMQIVALADNGHSKVRATIDGHKILLLPIRVSRFADGFFVMRTKSQYRDMLGGRVESIDGMPFGQVLKTLETFARRHRTVPG